MNVFIPFEKIIEFDTNIYEITKISLEDEYTLNNDSVLGNFIISGEYRENDILLDTKTFNKVLPFSVDITSNIDKDTFKLDINDFTYEIIDKNKLKVFIEYNISSKLEEFIEVDDNITNELDRINNNITIEEVIEEKEVEKEVIEEEYIKYHTYTIDENIDSIINNYNVYKSDILDINNISEFNINEKIIIPDESK